MTTALSVNGVAARHSSETNEHYTPSVVVEAARLAMGGIDLDPASCEAANRTVQAREWFTAKDNGFMRDWHGRVFLNPPGGSCDGYGVSLIRATKLAAGAPAQKGFFYADGTQARDGSQSAAKAWWFKLLREYKAGRIEQAIFVGFTVEILQTTQVDPPDDLPPVAAFPLCLPSRRVAYLTPRDGEVVVGSSPPHASVIAYVGVYVEAFRQAFAPLGRVINLDGGVAR